MRLQTIITGRKTQKKKTRYHEMPTKTRREQTIGVIKQTYHGFQRGKKRLIQYHTKAQNIKKKYGPMLEKYKKNLDDNSRNLF